MVSKVAVIALVAIVACPILLGYAMNLSEVTITDYDQSDDSVNVTPLLQDGYEYSYAAASVVDLNTRFYESGTPANPDYLSLITAKTAIPLRISVYSAGNVPLYPNTLSNFPYYYLVFNYDPSVGYATLNITYNDSTTTSIIRIHSVYYDYDNSKLYVSTYVNSGGQWVSSIFGILSNVNTISFTKTSGYNGTGSLYYYQTNYPPDHYVDLAAGYIVNKYSKSCSLDLPNHTKNLLFTMDLNTISSSSYTFDVSESLSQRFYRFEKTTDGSGIHWQVKWGYTTTWTVQDTITELYYDSSRSSNTYQITMNQGSIKFDYVGDWPTIIGKANSYWSDSFEYSTNNTNILVSFTNTSPKMRIDAGEYRAYTFPIINNKTYDPASFKTNPATTIENPSIYGESISFGGNTYAVSNGNITLGTHQISVSGLVFSSVPVAGGYENRIGNTAVSITVAPSTITFNGKWAASVSTASMESYTYTHTEWTPGQFAWDGLDQNFLMVGLLTSLGAFIALGIYIRKTKAALWPLLIVCGGAAMLFFCML